MKKGFTIVELMISLVIMIIVISICFSIYLQSLNSLNMIDISVDKSANMRIAVDFVSERIREGQNLIIGGGNVTIDGDKIYLKNNILRHGTDSQQIANNITFFGVAKVKETGLYEVTVGAGDLSQVSLIKKRK